MMNRNFLVHAGKDWWKQVATQWNRFWFVPRKVGVLATMRIIFGGLLLYSHLILAIHLEDFIGNQAWVSQQLGQHPSLEGSDLDLFSMSYLWDVQTQGILRLHQMVTILVTGFWCVGFLTRVTGPLCWFLQLMCVHRLTGALFGFDQIITYAVMYLMIAPTGSRYSIDAWLRAKISDRITSQKSILLDWLFPGNRSSVSANIATRLFQIHLCVIYLFGGLSKSRGVTWWDGSATWYSISNLEYQSIDMTWIAHYPMVIATLTTVTFLWELSYAALIWPRLTRPVVLSIALGVHLGIASALGMATFGFAMLAANLCFIEPRQVILSEDPTAVC